MSISSEKDLLKEISNWSTDEVVSLLRKNELDDCSNAITRRQIDGNELLHLTELKLSLWKSDLTRLLRRNLLQFIDELKKHPEKYIEEKTSESHTEEYASDLDSWGTDFDGDLEDNDPVENDTAAVPTDTIPRSPKFQENLNKFQQNDEAAAKQPTRQSSLRNSNNSINDSIYANSHDNINQEEVHEEETTYANYNTDTATIMNKLPEKNVSKLHSRMDNSVVQQLQQQLLFRKGNQKPVVHPKSDILLRKTEKSVERLRQKSFLHDTTARPMFANGVQNLKQTEMSTPPPPEPKRNFEKPTSIDRKINTFPKPPQMLQTVDLLVGLLNRTEEHDDDAGYEPVDKNIAQQHQANSMSRVGSKQSLMSGHQSSMESVYHSPSITSYEEEKEETHEIYEFIRDSPEDNDDYIPPRTELQKLPPPLPTKPHNQSATPSPTPILTRSLKGTERSPEVKLDILTHSASNTSLATEKATRPLPPTPDRQSYLEQPWFRNVTRQEAKTLIEEPPGGHPIDGYFLIRPSLSKPENPLTLVIWYKDKVYNVPVRKRHDNRYALGSLKQNEESFQSVEEIVPFYMTNELLLSTGGVITGSTKLTSTPPK